MALYWGELTMSALLAAQAAARPDATMLRFDAGAALSYGEADAAASRLANALAAIGIAQGEKLAVMLPNGPDFIRVWMGLARAGIIEVPVNIALRGALLRHQLALADCRAIIVAPDLLETLAPIAAELPELRQVIIAGAVPADYDLPWPALALDALIAAGSTAMPAARVAPADICAIMFTSGTTGPSKGALVNNAMYFHMARTCAEGAQYQADDVLYSVFPLFHINAKFLSIMPAMLAGAATVLHRRFTASGFWDICRAEGITAFNYMGAMLLILDKQPLRADDRAHSVRRAYGAPAPPAMSRVFAERFGVKLLECYGSTELGTVALSNPANIRPGSCGLPVPYYELAIHDAEGRECPPETPGELVARPRIPGAMFDGYYRMPEATLAAYRQLWFHTGDLAKKDADGWIYWLDRMKDAIRRRGENISSWEVEKVIDTHGCVLESAVLGVPSEMSEEEVLAVIVLKPGQAATHADIIAHCTAQLPRFAVPRYIRFVAALPKNISQRTEKFALRQQGVTPDTYDRERQP